MSQLTEQQAYLAMFAFLAAEYQLTKADELGGLLGNLSLLQDGMPADSAVLPQWKKAVAAALNGNVDASLRIGREK